MNRLLAMLLRLIPRPLRGAKRPIGDAAAEMQRLRRAIEKQIDADERRGRHG